MEIICLGDSVTSGLGVRREESWVCLLNRETEHSWTNAGIPGDTLPGMLSRLDSAILPQKPDAVFLLGGWNDLLICKQSDTARSCLMAMVHHCAHAGVKSVVGIPYVVERVPRQWADVCVGSRETLETYISWLRNMTAAFHLRTVDLGAAFADREGLLSDGVHPNASGHRLIADTIKEQSRWFE